MRFGGIASANRQIAARAVPGGPLRKGPDKRSICDGGGKEVIRFGFDREKVVCRIGEAGIAPELMEAITRYTIIGLNDTDPRVPRLLALHAGPLDDDYHRVCRACRGRQ